MLPVPQYNLKIQLIVVFYLKKKRIGTNQLKKVKKDGFEYSVGISLKSDLMDENIVNLKSEVKKWLTDKVNIFGLYKHEYYNEQEDFQFRMSWVVLRKPGKFQPGIKQVPSIGFLNEGDIPEVGSHKVTSVTAP